MCFICRSNRQPPRRLTCVRFCGHMDGPGSWNLHVTTALDDEGLAPPSAHWGPRHQSCKGPSEVTQLVPHTARLEDSYFGSAGNVIPTLLRHYDLMHSEIGSQRKRESLHCAVSPLLW